MKIEVYPTQRLSLRKITPEVMKYIFNELSDEEQMLFLGLSDVKALHIEKKKFADGLSTYNKKFEYFQLLNKADKIIGWCGYHTWYIDHHRAELGYGLFDETLKRKGLMTEALNFVIPHGFTTMVLNRIEAFTGESNDASNATLAKFGFVKEGVMREHYKSEGVIGDSLIFSLLKSEWQQH